MDKGEDSKQVTRLIDRLREAITHSQVNVGYSIASNAVQTERQMSQQQAIYDQITNFTVRAFRFVYLFTLTVSPFVKTSFDTLLKLHEVIEFNKLATTLANAGTEVPRGEEQAGFRYGTTGSAVLRGRW